MTNSARQLPLSLPHSPAMTREDFLVGDSNRAAVALVDRYPDWPNRAVVLIGPPGSGKTHLAAIWQGMTGAEAVDAADLRSADLEALVAGGHVVVEDIDAPSLDPEALFHLLNLVRERGAYALLTSRAPIAELGTSLADLTSRLRAATPVHLSEPEDALLGRVILKLFADRQLVVDPSVMEFLSRRMERSLGAARRLVETLDQAALAAGRPVTRQLAAAILADELRDDKNDG